MQTNSNHYLASRETLLCAFAYPLVIGVNSIINIDLGTLQADYLIGVP